jgi:hypothetical protein
MKLAFLLNFIGFIIVACEGYGGLSRGEDWLKILRRNNFRVVKVAAFVFVFFLLAVAVESVLTFW